MNWFLLETPPRGGDYNMAVDEYLMGLSATRGVPVLRLYQWERPTLSVGRNQRLDKTVDFQACHDAGVHIVRRMTGGQAVLHGSDLTYAVSAPLDGSDFGESILSTYRALSRVFLLVFSELGFRPTVQTYSGRQRHALASPICFVTPSAQEILIGGKKLVGSAQRRRPEGFLQHGSIPYAPQAEMLAKLLHGASRVAVAEAMTDLQSMGLWKRMREKDFRARLLGAFAAVFQAEWEPLPWNEHDDRAVEAIRPRYQPLDNVAGAPTATAGEAIPATGSTPDAPAAAARGSRSVESR